MYQLSFESDKTLISILSHFLSLACSILHQRYEGVLASECRLTASSAIRNLKELRLYVDCLNSANLGRLSF